MGPPTPAPELKKLEVFSGEWTAQGTMTTAPGAPAGKWTMTTHGDWMEGNFFLIQHDEMDLGAMGKVKEIAVLGYDSGRTAPNRAIHRLRAWQHAACGAMPAIALGPSST